ATALLGFVAVESAPAAFAAQPVAMSPAQLEVLHASEARQQAFNERDLATYRKLTDATFLSVIDNGTGLTLDDIVRGTFPSPRDNEQQVGHHDASVRIYGDTAILIYTLEDTESFDGSLAVHQQRRTEVWQRGTAGWRVIASHFSNLPVNMRPPIVVVGENVQDYVGKYQWRKGLVDTVTVEGGKLWSQLTGAASKSENLALAKGVYFLRDDLGTAIFTRDAQGKVDGYIYRGPDGQEIRVKKIS
ncbi:MAG: nuclear transport factor 2 family protein, partial [Thermoanaerobaculia bacterium]